MPIKILAVGKKHEAWVGEGIERYQKRLRMPFSVEWVLLPHSSLDGAAARQEESGRISSRLNDSDYVVLLDERGKMLSSPQLAQLFDASFQSSRSIVIIIGGAFGVDESIHGRAQVIWSLSALVFPHQLVRLILTEQLYRSQQILQGGAYHHE